MLGTVRGDDGKGNKRGEVGGDNVGGDDGVGDDGKEGSLTGNGNAGVDDGATETALHGDDWLLSMHLR